ncbi:MULTISPECIES: Clp protease N-terminal domain-containing protein [unclassified Pseudofrankia]|uniref:Clp protease N-terminal domain-containing protein n=1 Tax=unclassified Pseudofrankia TaxID=2994372 RepID=UPI0008D8E4BF|nr:MULTISPECIES: Clp protease N-terminal domain-containing protein [unclassified Pseudofrankia]MDT3441613.1 Clp protease N-terminal domain-containing protein [Pseudofrankia sp. BMG5.37]OHV45548.1 Clp protease [Pseudofrankia sp. BMG5.36]
MPARFAAGARGVVGAALAEARLRGDRRIGTEHLLLGVLHHPDTEAARALGVDLPAARSALAALDQAALAALGIAVGALAPAAPADDGVDPWPAARAPASGEPASGDDPAAVLFGHDRQRPTPAQVAQLRTALSSGARAVLSRALAVAPTTPARRVTPELVLLALLERPPPDPAATLLDRLGVDRAAARGQLGDPS